MKPTFSLLLLLAVTALGNGCSSSKPTEQAAGSTSNLTYDDCERQSDECVKRCEPMTDEDEKADCNHSCSHEYAACSHQISRCEEDPSLDGCE